MSYRPNPIFKLRDHKQDYKQNKDDVIISNWPEGFSMFPLWSCLESEKVAVMKDDISWGQAREMRKI